MTIQLVTVTEEIKSLVLTSGYAIGVPLNIGDTVIVISNCGFITVKFNNYRFGRYTNSCVMAYQRRDKRFIQIFVK